MAFSDSFATGYTIGAGIMDARKRKKDLEKSNEEMFKLLEVYILPSLSPKVGESVTADLARLQDNADNLSPTAINNALTGVIKMSQAAETNLAQQRGRDTTLSVLQDFGYGQQPGQPQDDQRDIIDYYPSADQPTAGPPADSPFFFNDTPAAPVAPQGAQGAPGVPGAAGPPPLSAFAESSPGMVASTTGLPENLARNVAEGGLPGGSTRLAPAAKPNPSIARTQAVLADLAGQKVKELDNRGGAGGTTMQQVTAGRIEDFRKAGAILNHPYWADKHVQFKNYRGKPRIMWWDPTKSGNPMASPNQAPRKHVLGDWQNLPVDNFVTEMTKMGHAPEAEAATAAPAEAEATTAPGGTAPDPKKWRPAKTGVMDEIYKEEGLPPRDFDSEYEAKNKDKWQEYYKDYVPAQAPAGTPQAVQAKASGLYNAVGGLNVKGISDSYLRHAGENATPDGLMNTLTMMGQMASLSAAPAPEEGAFPNETHTSKLGDRMNIIDQLRNLRQVVIESKGEATGRLDQMIIKFKKWVGMDIGEPATAVEQASHAVGNALLRALSGAAVTEHEMKRVQEQIGRLDMNDANYLQRLEAELKNQEAAYDHQVRSFEASGFDMRGHYRTGASDYVNEDTEYKRQRLQQLLQLKAQRQQ